jgi:hypothetical protein
LLNCINNHSFTSAAYRFTSAATSQVSPAAPDCRAALVYTPSMLTIICHSMLLLLLLLLLLPAGPGGCT